MKEFEAFSKKARRLQGYDYRWAGLYFVTICTQGREPYFGDVVNGEMIVSDEGQIAFDYWLEIAQPWPHVMLGEFVVMPNHVHGIIGLENPSEKYAILPVPGTNTKATILDGPAKNQEMAALAPKVGSLSHIIGLYKSACTKIIRSVSTEPFGWQPRFYDRIIRSQRELENIEQYILNNPTNWEQDQLFKT